jgi:hypothetical protein
MYIIGLLGLLAYALGIVTGVICAKRTEAK